MVVRPEELIDNLTPEQEQQVKELEEIIDSVLRKYWTPEGNLNHVSIPFHPEEKVRSALIKLYRNAGWVMKFEDDQRDGNFVVVKASPRV